MLFSALIFIALIHEGLSITCYECSAVDKGTCEKQQRIEKCYKSDRCMTVSYNLVNNDGTRNDNIPVYTKRCMTNAESCRRYCIKMKDLLQVKDCQVSCCGVDGCNKKEESIRPRQSRKTKATNNEHSLKMNTFLLLSTIILWHFCY